MKDASMFRRVSLASAVALVAGTLGVIAAAPAAASTASAVAAVERDYPPFEKVVEGLEKVVSTTDGSAGFYDLYADRETGKLMAVLPRNYASQMQMIACTISGGDSQAGVMGPTFYVKWKKIGDQLALVSPNFNVRTSGDAEARDSVASLYTDRVLLSVPIVSMQGGRPVIDLGSMATRQAGSFFGSSVFGGYGASAARLNPALATLTKAKSFPENIIVEYELPRSSGELIKLTYSIGTLEGSRGFKPRKADPRVGYFYDWHQDFAKSANQEVTERYISRWNIEKRDPKLKVSPPKEPLVWYIEHTTPVEYRRYVREGILLWNKAYREIGIDGALEVRQQDAATGAYMDIDPEDARYNFFRWNASNQSYAIGPSRTNPETGEILDADVVWHQGLTRSIRNMLESMTADLTESTFHPETLAFFDEHPTWDPRVRIAEPAARAQMLKARQLDAAKAVTTDLHDEDHPWTHASANHANTACQIGNMLAMDISLADAALVAGLLPSGGDDAQLLDGLPEEFIGPMIRYITAHEVGHCLGLQHNMAASSIRTLEEINTEGFEGPTVGSVMDYVAVNINYELGDVQGPYASSTIGPYDYWAIAFGYGPENEVNEVLKRVSEPDHIFISQPAISIGADPRNMTWDMGADNLTFAESRIGLANELRGRLIDDIVKDGESWAQARRRFMSLMSTHVQSMFIASRWIGGTYTNNDFKGDPGDRKPIEDVEPAQQRRALKLIMDNAFNDDAFGITPELVRHLGKEYWWDPSGMGEIQVDPSLTLHDMVGSIQATALSLIMNPTTLRRVYDNEFRADPDTNPITAAEIVGTVTKEVWSELGGRSAKDISSFRRNLQREHVQRLIDLALLDNTSSPTLRTISALAANELRSIDEMVKGAKSSDPYTSAHLADISTRIGKALDAAYVVNQ